MWQIDDTSTARLPVRFHQEILRDADALTGYQLDYPAWCQQDLLAAGALRPEHQLRLHAGRLQAALRLSQRLGPGELIAGPHSYRSPGGRRSSPTLEPPPVERLPPFVQFVVLIDLHAHFSHSTEQPSQPGAEEREDKADVPTRHAPPDNLSDARRNMPAVIPYQAQPQADARALLPRSSCHI